MGRAGLGQGRTVHEHGLDNGRLRVAVWEYGATLVEVSVPDGARRANLVVRLPDLAAYERKTDRAYVGSTMGRYARIVSSGTARIGGRPHRLARNAGEHHIHGGPDGFDARVWDGRAEDGPDSGRIAMCLHSPHGDQGYPGNLRCTATFELHTDDRLVVRYEAVTDRTTLCGPTLHAFWNLTGGREPVDRHLLRLNADALVEAGEEFVPTGRVLPVDGTPYDLRAERTLGAAALDGCVAVAPGPWTATLRVPGGARGLRLATDQPGLAVYTGDHLPQPRAGVCLQPGPWPDAPHHTAFPSAELAPGAVYRSETTYTFFQETRTG
ncbi:aldose epimerase family protein [Actinacidiphila yeochonensis]|uniref:aldose epimerase family protein n=1 Tax=Actinacidiphila yeochonensis TaxID=89050 RepID=UPI00068B4BBE|nr:aldose epimerase family protein [Actinacidiphila yeochonensis]